MHVVPYILQHFFKEEGGSPPNFSHTIFKKRNLKSYHERSCIRQEMLFCGTNVPSSFELPEFTLQGTNIKNLNFLIKVSTAPTTLPTWERHQNSVLTLILFFLQHPLNLRWGKKRREKRSIKRVLREDESNTTLFNFLEICFCNKLHVNLIYL